MSEERERERVRRTLANEDEQNPLSSPHTSMYDAVRTSHVRPICRCCGWTVNLQNATVSITNTQTHKHTNTRAHTHTHTDLSRRENAQIFDVSGVGSSIYRQSLGGEELTVQCMYLRTYGHLHLSSPAVWGTLSH